MGVHGMACFRHLAYHTLSSIERVAIQMRRSNYKGLPNARATEPAGCAALDEAAGSLDMASQLSRL